MATTNERLQDSSVKHSIYLLRYGGGVAKRIVTLLDKTDADLVNRIRDRLDRIDKRGFDLGPATTARLTRLMVEVRTLNRELFSAVHADIRSELYALAKAEADMTARRLESAVGVDFGVNRPSPELLRSAVTSQPFYGKPLREWTKTIETDKIRRVSEAVRIGMVEGQTTDQIITRLRGTRAAAYRDGVLETTRKTAEMVVRTAVNHIANRAQNLLFEANSDVIQAVRWTSTLDARTTPVCQARDGEVYPLDSGPRPPAHPNCRSIVVPVLKSWDEMAGNGSLKAGRGSTNMETIFQQRLADRGFSPDAIDSIVMNARASINGEVPGDLTYGSWLGRQSVDVQDDVLGRTKGQLFRKGGLTVDRFVDRAGRELSLDQLRAKYPSAFDAAGLE